MDERLTLDDAGSPGYRLARHAFLATVGNPVVGVILLAIALYFVLGTFPAFDE